MIEMMPSGSPKPQFSISNKVMTKVCGIALLVLALLIPLSFIKSTLMERRQRNDEAVAEITSSWGKQQVLVGPVLVVPYRYKYKAIKDKIVDGKVRKIEAVEEGTAKAWFLPDDLGVDGGIQPEKLHRGIYEAVVYRGTLKISGSFSSPDFQSLKIPEDQVLWDDAVIAVGVTDLRGTASALKFTLGDKSFRMAPGTFLKGFPTGVHARVGDSDKSGKKIPFSMEVSLKGSRGISFAPIGIQNVVVVKSPWADPSFNGRFLPAERSISPEGFEAIWKVSYYGRDYSQSSTSDFPAEQVQDSLFGVSFYKAVDSYRKVERAIKYGILFLTLVFSVFFIFEILAPLKIHVVQYTLVGMALCLFYLGLLSVSEFIQFGAAYALAAISSILMISLYALTILHSGGRTLLVAMGLGAIYAFLYVTLQLQDYSLLLGTIGLFAAVSAIMYLTRNLDWHALDKK